MSSRNFNIETERHSWINKVQRSNETFERLVSNVQRSASNKDPLAVAGWAQIAAYFAWYSHPGVYSSPTIEHALLGVAKDLKCASCIGEYDLPKRNGSKKNVLHVMTEAYSIGGHTKVVEKWIKHTSLDTTHLVVTTRSSTSTPNWLVEAAILSGGGYLSLGKSSRDFLKVASDLRFIANKWADLVVLHTHPMDPTPIIAFGVKDVPPVVLFNHADHVFWLGSSVADIVADFRISGQNISIKRRGAKKAMILPIPLEQKTTFMDKKIARDKLGIQHDSIVLLTVASEYKFTSCGEYDLLDVVGSIVEKDSRLSLLAIGPKNRGKWSDFKTRTNGRLRALGIQKDLNDYHAAADIYLNSFPFGSLTSMLEVGMKGKALLGLENTFSPLFTGDDVSLDRLSVFAKTPEVFEEELGKLANSTSLRMEKGKMVSESIITDHCNPGWLNYLDSILNSLPAEHSISEIDPIYCKFDPEDLFLNWFDEKAHGSGILNRSFAKNGRYLPFAERMNLLGNGVLGKSKGFGILPPAAYLGKTIHELFHGFKRK